MDVGLEIAYRALRTLRVQCAVEEQSSWGAILRHQGKENCARKGE